MQDAPTHCITCGARLDGRPHGSIACSMECKHAHDRGITLAEELHAEMDAMGWGEREHPPRSDSEERACSFPSDRVADPRFP